LVFPTAIGTATDPRYYRRSLARATRAAGIGDEWTPHELRHTCASLLRAHAGSDCALSV
jgi:integrase